ncbi:MAG: EVE domain-containing protein [Nitrososphaerales archaeon]
MHWLFKEEPSHYSFDDLVKEGKTTWSGVHNNLALKYLRSVKKGDLIFYYHTGDEKQIVGVMKASSSAYSLDKVEITKSKEVAVDVIPSKKLAKPVSLESIKKDKRFSDFPLVRISRLSVMSVSDEQWELICSMSD